MTGNDASLNGGGIHSFGTLTIRRSTISNNRAMGFTGGGGLLLDGPFTLANVTISGNRATRSGGGLYALAAQVLSLTNVTIAENVSENFAGAGIFANMSPKFGRLAVKNTVVANNHRPVGP